MRLRRSVPVSRLIEDLHGRHYLTAADLPPFLVLLSLETGLEIECCKALTIDCLRNASAGVVDVAYVKRRARGAEYKTIKVRDGGVGTPGGLIRRVIEVTAAARRHHSNQGLWIDHRCGTLTDHIGHSRETIDAWTRRYSIVDDESRPLRLVLSRLRKTHKALWYLKTEGHMARFAVGHTPEVAARHYADVPSLRPLHEAAAADAFTEAVARSTPIVLTPAREEAWRRASEHADGPVQNGHVAALLSGDQDVWLASFHRGYDFQAKILYKERWESFISNAGIVQAFAPQDMTTRKYLSDLADERMTWIDKESKSSNVTGVNVSGGTSTAPANIKEPLIYPYELGQMQQGQSVFFTARGNVLRSYFPDAAAKGFAGVADMMAEAARNMRP